MCIHYIYLNSYDALFELFKSGSIKRTILKRRKKVMNICSLPTIMRLTPNTQKVKKNTKLFQSSKTMDNYYY